jgi:hypothetical protein
MCLSEKGIEGNLHARNFKLLYNVIYSVFKMLQHLYMKGIHSTFKSNEVVLIIDKMLLFENKQADSTIVDLCGIMEPKCV